MKKYNNWVRENISGETIIYNILPITYDKTACFLDDLYEFIGWSHSEGGAQTNHEVALLGMLKGPV